MQEGDFYVFSNLAFRSTVFAIITGNLFTYEVF